MSRFALTMLQIGLLLLLYLFIWRTVRSVGAGMSERPAKSAPPTPATPKAVPKPRRRKAGGPPSSVVVLTKQGKKAGTHKLDTADARDRSSGRVRHHA